MTKLPPKKPRKATETDLVNEIRVVLGKLPYVTVWRNNVGMLKDAKGRPVRYGLCVGSSDLIGIVHNHAGRGIFIAIEVKLPGKSPTEDQDRFIRAVGKMGASATWVTSVEEAVQFVQAVEAR